MRRINPNRLVLAVLGFGLCAALCGCYERVVNAKGLGAEQYEVSQPYQENSKLDDWIFGERKSDKYKLNN